MNIVAKCLKQQYTNWQIIDLLRLRAAALPPFALMSCGPHLRMTCSMLALLLRGEDENQLA